MKGDYILDDDLIEYYYEGFISFIHGILDDLKECDNYTQYDIHQIIKKNASSRIENPKEVIQIRHLFFNDPTKKLFLLNIKKWIYSFLKSSRKELKLDKKAEKIFISHAIDFFFSRAIELNRVAIKLDHINKTSLLKETIKDIESILREKY